MISCGLQCINCPYPIHLDTYSGCSHACRYCFANEKLTIANIKPLNNAKQVTKPSKAIKTQIAESLMIGFLGIDSANPFSKVVVGVMKDIKTGKFKPKI